MKSVNLRFAAAAALLFLAACTAQGGKEKEGGILSWLPDLPKVNLAKGDKTLLISDLAPGSYKASSLAIGEEKDLAQRRGEGLGFVRSAPLEQYLGALRSKLAAASGMIAVPGRVMILANPAFAAYSTPDGNLYISMGCLETVKSEDEVVAILAHELAHVLLTHHSSDIISAMQKKTQSLHEIVVNAKTALLSATKTVSKDDSRRLFNEQVVVDVTDRLALPAWGRGQEKEADLLGVDLLIRTGYSPGAMVSILEMLQTWEKQTRAAEESFWEKFNTLSVLNNPTDALKNLYQETLKSLPSNHPKTEERITETAEYLDRHYADLKPVEVQAAPWKAISSRKDVAQVLGNYRQAFLAMDRLTKGKAQEAYPIARNAATGNTATDAYPNWVLYRAAKLLGRQKEALDALTRALKSPEQVPEIYDAMILDYEQAGTFSTALDWANKASTTFGGAPRWIPPRIRLLRKLGRIPEAESLAVNCAVNTPDFKRECQEANKTAAGPLKR